MKKITIVIGCMLLVVASMFFASSGKVQAATTGETFKNNGDVFEYEILSLGDSSTHGTVKLLDYDETSSITKLNIPNEVVYDSVTYDVTTIGSKAFENAEKVEEVHFPANVVEFMGRLEIPFVHQSNDFDANASISTSLKKITVDSANPTLKIENGVLYNMDAKEIVLYPLLSEQTHYVMPTFIFEGNSAISFDQFVMTLAYAKNLEYIDMPVQDNQKGFTEEGILYRWKDINDHSLGSKIFIIPPKMKHVKFSSTLTDLSSINILYAIENTTLDYSLKNNSIYQVIDKNVYSNSNQLLFVPGGRTKPIYRIPNNTKIIGERGAPVVFANKSLQTLIIPTSVDEVSNGSLISPTLKSIMVEGDGDINWDAQSFYGQPVHVYFENGQTNVETKMRAKIPTLNNDKYFHELGKTPMTTVADVKVNIENKKDVKITWNASEAGVNYEVRRYDATGNYVVIDSTNGNETHDTTTAYNTEYQYVVVPYTLPVTNSGDVTDPLYNYHTYGTESSKVSIKTPVQVFKATYKYKKVDGTETSITKDINAGESALANAPKVSNINGYDFEQWTSDLQNIEYVDKDFTATAIYKEKIGTLPDGNQGGGQQGDQGDNQQGNQNASQQSGKQEKIIVDTGDDTMIWQWLSLLVSTGIIFIGTSKKTKRV